MGIVTSLNAIGKRNTTLFPGQFADIKAKDLARRAHEELGLEGIGICTWGDYWDVGAASNSKSYIDDQFAVLTHGGKLAKPVAIENHLVTQFLTTPKQIIELDADDYKSILPPEIWGDGEPSGVKSRAMEQAIKTVISAKNAKINVVVGFVGSPIWHKVYQFPPTSKIDAGFKQAAKELQPLLRACAENGVYYALEVHPTEIAFDYYTTLMLVDALEKEDPNTAKWFGINFDPSHFIKQGVDPVAVLENLSPSLIKYVHVKDAVNHLAGLPLQGNLKSNLNSHLGFGDPRRASDFALPGEGHAVWNGPRGIFEILNKIGYDGPAEIEYEHAARDRFEGVQEAARFVKNSQRKIGEGFEAAFDRSKQA